MDINDAVRLVLDLVDCQTFNWPNNEMHFRRCCNLIKRNLNELGVDVEFIETTMGPVVVGYREGTKRSSHIHFNGHYDTVPLAKRQKTSTLDSIDSCTERVYGRGSSDMKGGIVAFWLALKQMVTWNNTPHLSFSFSPDEELGGLRGTKAIIDWIKKLKQEPTLTIVGDSSYPDIVIGHRGALWVELTCRVGYHKRFCTTDGPSAFMIAAAIAPRLEEEIRKKGLGCVLGGDCSSSSAPNVRPEDYSFSMDLRFDYPRKPNDVENTVRDIVKEMGNELNIRGVIHSEIRLTVDSCPGITLNGHNLLSIVKMIIPKCRTVIGQGFSDLRLFRRAFSCPSFILGPGEPPEAHTSGESIDISAIVDCAKAYLSIVEAYRDVE